MSMGRKRKKSDDVVSASTRSRPAPAARHRIVTVYRTTCGRLGQTMSYVPMRPADAPATSNAASEADHNHHMDLLATSDANDPAASSMFDFSDPSMFDNDSEHDLGLGRDDTDDEHHSTAPDDDGTGSQTTHHPNRTLDWAANFCTHYLDEMARHDGRAGCEQCVGLGCAGDGLYKCKDCFGCQVFCRECCVRMHSLLPFHRILVRLLLLRRWSSAEYSLTIALDRTVLRGCFPEVPRGQAISGSRRYSMRHSR